ncbi:hypothetical protein JCM31598_24590 [Desulfonatronum parangueonense]
MKNKNNWLSRYQGTIFQYEEMIRERIGLLFFNTLNMYFFYGIPGMIIFAAWNFDPMLDRLPRLLNQLQKKHLLSAFSFRP